MVFVERFFQECEILMKLVCKDCKYEQTILGEDNERIEEIIKKTIVQDRSLTQCPQCGSSNIKIFLFGSTSGQGLKIMIEKSNVALIIIFVIGGILAFSGLATLFVYSSWPGGIALIVIGIIIILVIGHICNIEGKRL